MTEGGRRGKRWERVTERKKMREKDKKRSIERRDREAKKRARVVDALKEREN